MADKELRSEISGRGLVIPRRAAVLPTFATPLGGGKQVVKVELARGENDGLQAEHPETREPLFLNGDESRPMPAHSEHVECYCVYPDGFRRTHQVKTVGELLDRIIMIFRNHYGVRGEIAIHKAPENLQSGTEVEVIV